MLVQLGNTIIIGEHFLEGPALFLNKLSGLVADRLFFKVIEIFLTVPMKRGDHRQIPPHASIIVLFAFDIILRMDGGVELIVVITFLVVVELVFLDEFNSVFAFAVSWPLLISGSNRGL